MKRIFFWIFYLAYLVCFNFFLAVLSFFVILNGKFVDFLIRLNLSNEFIEKIVLLKDVWFILINLFFAYLFSRMKINRKKLLIFPLIVVGIKAVLFLLWAGLIMASPELDVMGQGGVFVFIIVYGLGTSVAILDIAFYIGLVIFSMLKRKKENTFLEKNKVEILEGE